MSVVARVACPDYRAAGAAFRRVVELAADGAPLVGRGEPLMVKPNLLAAYAPAAAVTTHPAIVEAALEVASDLGAKPFVADSPGLGSVRRVARVSGILDVCRRHGVKLVDLGEETAEEVSARDYRCLPLARIALQTPWLWNLPKWKTHTMMGLTLGVKNLYGCVPGKLKVSAHFRSGRGHRAFARQLLGIDEVLRPRLTVLDGVVAMEGPGPARGNPLSRGLLLASSNAPGLDWEATRLSGFAAQDVPTVRLSVAEGRVSPQQLQIRGDPAELLQFIPAPGSPSDWALPRPLRALVRGAVSPAPRFDGSLCDGCEACVRACPATALKAGIPPEFVQEACIRCYCCQELCPAGAVRVPPRRFLGVGSRLAGRGR